MATPSANGSLRRLRIITAGVLVSVIALMVVADIVDAFLGSPRDYQIEPLVLGTLLGGLLLTLGIEVGTRLPLPNILKPPPSDDERGQG